MYIIYKGVHTFLFSLRSSMTKINLLSCTTHPNFYKICIILYSNITRNLSLNKLNKFRSLDLIHWQVLPLQ